LEAAQTLVVESAGRRDLRTEALERLMRAGGTDGGAVVWSPLPRWRTARLLMIRSPPTAPTTYGALLATHCMHMDHHGTNGRLGRERGPP
ncbi:MAG: hypothetical protein QOG39_977, partial [Acidimicrobiaceae bacterium]